MRVGGLARDNGESALLRQPKQKRTACRCWKDRRACRCPGDLPELRLRSLPARLKNPGYETLDVLGRKSWGAVRRGTWRTTRVLVRVEILAAKRSYPSARRRERPSARRRNVTSSWCSLREQRRPSTFARAPVR